MKKCEKNKEMKNFN